jgi:choline transport protein
LNALGLVSLVIVLLQLLNIGSSTALFAILGLSTIGLYLSYILPVLFIIIAKVRGDQITYGPFKLHALGLPINLFALCYGIFILVWLPFPPFLPVTGENMNYAGPIMAAVLIAAVLDWLITGKTRFKVPSEFKRPHRRL